MMTTSLQVDGRLQCDQNNAYIAHPLIRKSDWDEMKGHLVDNFTTGDRSPQGPVGRPDMRTPEGRALAHLLDDLATLRSGAETMGAPELAQAFADRLAITPCVWPLDEFVLTMILETACFDLGNPGSLAAAGALTAFMLGTGVITIVWSCPGTPSPLQVCVLAEDDAHEAGVVAAAEGCFDHELQVRRFLERRYRDEDLPPDSRAA